MATNLVPISSVGGFTTTGNITVSSFPVASPAPTISGFSSVSADNFRLLEGNITGGIATVVTDGINSITLALGAQMDVYGFPFSGGGVRGQLTISDVTTPSEVNGTWYYQSINTYTYQIYTDSTYASLVDATSWSAYTGGGNVAITKQVPAANIVINTNGYFSKFNNDGQLNLPGNLLVPNNAYISATNATGNVVGKTINIQAGAADQTDYYATAGGNLNLIGGLGAGNDGGGGGPGGSVNITSGNSADVAGHAGNVTINSGSNTWTFDYNGNLSTGNINFSNGSHAVMSYGANNYININNDGGMDLSCNTEVRITTNYGDGSNRAYSYFYANGTFSTDTIVASGNVTGAYILGNGSQLTGITASAGSNIANGNSNVSIATANGNVTIAAVGNTTMTITGTGANITGTANISGNLVAGNLIGPLANGNSNVTIATAAGNVVTNINGSAILTTYSGGIKVGGSGILQSPGGASAMTLNNNGANIPTANITTALNVTGASGANITANLTAGNISTGGTLTSTGKFGYASGSTVTQTTNRGNGVTINALAGTIVTTSAAMVANEIDTFSVINSSVNSDNDIVLAQIVSPNLGTYNCIANPTGTIGGFSSGFYINIVNISGFTTSDETITIRFMVIKAPNA